MSSSQSASILIVDDEPNNFEVIEILLFQQGYDLSYANSGMEAIAQLQVKAPDVILLDVMMPDLDGLEVCQQIKANSDWQHIPIVMVTALQSREDLARCLGAGANDFLSKPVNGLELRARVQSMVRIKQQYDALKQLLLYREESLQLREEMADMVIHDLRNPLSSILLGCYILQASELPDRQYQKVLQIERAGQQLSDLIDSLLIMAKLDGGKVALNLVEVDLYTLGSETIEDFQTIATQRRVELLGKLPGVGTTVHLDAPLLRRVLDNLISNALKFSPTSSQVIVEIDCPSKSQVRIQVKDQGRGVSEELRQSIFEKYEIGESCQGIVQIGLGLTFCKMVVEAHGGRIFVAPQEPKGSIFTVEI
jgi:two-component system, sensor histidine kinase and response regulator